MGFVAEDEKTNFDMVIELTKIAMQKDIYFTIDAKGANHLVEFMEILKKAVDEMTGKTFQSKI